MSSAISTINFALEGSNESLKTSKKISYRNFGVLGAGDIKVQKVEKSGSICLWRDTASPRALSILLKSVLQALDSGELSQGVDDPHVVDL